MNDRDAALPLILSVRAGGLTRVRAALIAGLAVWCVVASIFGVQLYLPPNRSIANPTVNAIIPAAKDGAWIALVCFSLLAARYAQRRTTVTFGRSFVVLSAVALLTLGVQIALSTCVGGCDTEAFPFLKNLLLYLLGGIVVGYVAGNLRLEKEALSAVLAALLAALATSVAVFAFFEYDFKLIDWSLDPTRPLLRMYGTMGNPNSIGWAAVIAIPLIMLGPRLGLGRGALQFAALVLAFVAIYCSASFSALVGAVVAVAVYTLVAARGSSIWRPVAAAAVAFALALPLATFATPGHTLELVQRVDKMSHTPPESIDVRKRDLERTTAELQTPAALLLGSARGAPDFRQHDSILLTLFHNFGAVGLSLFLLPWLYALWLLLRVWRAAPDDLVTLAVAPTLVSLLLVNAPLQSQLQLFPLDFFASFLLGIWVTAALRGMSERAARQG